MPDTRRIFSVWMVEIDHVVPLADGFPLRWPEMSNRAAGVLTVRLSVARPRVGQRSWSTQRSIAATVRSTSCSSVAQSDTEMRVRRRSRHVVPLT